MQSWSVETLVEQRAGKRASPHVCHIAPVTNEDGEAGGVPMRQQIDLTWAADEGTKGRVRLELNGWVLGNPTPRECGRGEH